MAEGAVVHDMHIQVLLSKHIMWCIYRRIPRLRPPFLHASIGQKWGGGLYAGS